MEDMTLKIFQSFLTLKRPKATKAFVLSVTVTQEQEREDVFTAAAQGLSSSSKKISRPQYAEWDLNKIEKNF